MISLEIRSKRFGGVEVLGDFSVTVEAGATLAISGPSGIGKTTLLRILAGLDLRYEGRLEGARRPAIVFQEPVLLPWRSALDNIVVVTRASQSRAEKVLAEVGLADRAERFPGQLSLGQQRRLALARAFSADPDLLLLDEPFVSLDPSLTEEMLLLTERLLAARRIPTVLVTHAPAEAQRLATRLAVLEGAPAVLREIAD